MDHRVVPRTLAHSAARSLHAPITWGDAPSRRHRVEDATVPPPSLPPPGRPKLPLRPSHGDRAATAPSAQPPWRRRGRGSRDTTVAAIKAGTSARVADSPRRARESMGRARAVYGGSRAPWAHQPPASQTPGRPGGKSTTRCEREIGRREKPTRAATRAEHPPGRDPAPLAGTSKAEVRLRTGDSVRRKRSRGPKRIEAKGSDQPLLDRPRTEFEE